jgi:hypothetical protein
VEVSLSNIELIYKSSKPETYTIYLHVIYFWNPKECHHIADSLPCSEMSFVDQILNVEDRCLKQDFKLSYQRIGILNNVASSNALNGEAGDICALKPKFEQLLLFRCPRRMSYVPEILEHSE